MKRPIHNRRFEVDFYEQEEHLWRITSQLRDDIHDIRVELDISVPDMVVKDAGAEFVRYPLEECLAAAPIIGKLVGACLFQDFSERSRRLFLGPGGCPNVMNLLSTSAPALIYFYFPDQIRKGAMKREEWWEMCGTKLVNECLAHRMIAAKDTEAL